LVLTIVRAAAAASTVAASGVDGGGYGVGGVDADVECPVRNLENNADQIPRHQPYNPPRNQNANKIWQTEIDLSPFRIE